MTLAHRIGAAVIGLAVTMAASSCGWRGPESLPLPGTQGRGAGAYTIQAEIPDVDNIAPNSRVRVGDVTVGTVARIERQGWHALLTMTINGEVRLPANATATVGQTSLLGSRHIELAPPSSDRPEGRLHDGSLIPLDAAAAYPTTEQTLAAVSLLLNGGGIGQIQDITETLSGALAGRENDLRSLMRQVDMFVASLNDQIDEIIAATESLDRLVGQVADQKPALDRALQTIPTALRVLKDHRENLASAIDTAAQFAALTADSVNQTKQSLVSELNQLGPVLRSLADSGPALTRSLSVLTTFPWVKENIPNWFRGDLANAVTVFDFTLSRIDQGLFTGTRFEGALTKLELQWGRTIGQLPSPYTSGNPLLAPYHQEP
ncbi:MCE family protein [[Mycobacterium] burgundiense]|uniref:MCE family protein n=1 Tax=[Mycobacterium] burgundiense TaxID=3064286 RepID=A0ABM9M4F9_9MYCO|nr:MCE family protein [Mycolicibacterium sp. MU0053]CAJ1510022.1 MCE family protein [Mycolicibacterium sp. MU0053]